jgi:hypothetical protein
VDGPGKFEGEDTLTLWAFDKDSEGWADEQVSNEGWGDGAALIRGPFDPAGLRADRLDEYGFLNRAERREILRSAGVVVSWDSQGFVTADWFATPTELDLAWAAFESDYASDDEADPDDDETGD